MTFKLASFGWVEGFGLVMIEVTGFDYFYTDIMGFMANHTDQNSTKIHSFSQQKIPNAPEYANLVS